MPVPTGMRVSGNWLWILLEELLEELLAIDRLSIWNLKPLKKVCGPIHWSAIEPSRVRLLALRLLFMFVCLWHPMAICPAHCFQAMRCDRKSLAGWLDRCIVLLEVQRP